MNTVDNNNNDILSTACMGGKLKTVKELLEKGVDPSVPHNTPICNAASGGHIKIVRYLLKDKRVDVQAHQNYPLCVAAEKGDWEMVELLLKNGVDTNETPKMPHLIISKDHIAVIELLRTTQCKFIIVD